MGQKINIKQLKLIVDKEEDECNFWIGSKWAKDLATHHVGKNADFLYYFVIFLYYSCISSSVQFSIFVLLLYSNTLFNLSVK